MGMLQVIKNNSGWLVAIAHLPNKGLAALRYRLFVAFADEDISSRENSEKACISSVPSEKNISFTFAVISLSALVAKADGKISKEEYLAFRDSFPLTGGICSKIRELFMLACESNYSPTHHATQIKNLFPQQKDLFIALMERLFRVAIADGDVSKEQERLLAKIAHSLNLSPSEYSNIYDKYSRPLPAHEVLGVKRRSPREVIKHSYHSLMRRYHPDRFASEQTSTEVKMILTLKSAEISQAYKTLTKKAA